MLTNPRDAFRGQSRSSNTVPFDMLDMHGFLLVYYNNFVPWNIRLVSYTVTLKPGLWSLTVCRNWHGSIRHVWFPI